MLRRRRQKLELNCIASNDEESHSAVSREAIKWLNMILFIRDYRLQEAHRLIIEILSNPGPASVTFNRESMDALKHKTRVDGDVNILASNIVEWAKVLSLSLANNPSEARM